MAYPKTVLRLALSKAKRAHFKSLRETKNSNDVPVLSSVDNSTSETTKKANKIIVPFVKTLETLRCPLKKSNCELVFTYKNKLKNKLCNNKPKINDTKSGVYYIPCDDCDKIYLGETGRDLKRRLKEHRRDIVYQKPESGVATHVRKQGHVFNFKNAKIIVPCNNKKKRHIIESAMIKKFSNMDRCVNLNYGFSPRSELLSKYIIDVVNLRNFVT